MKATVLLLLVIAITALPMLLAQQQCQGGYSQNANGTCVPVCFNLLASNINVCSQHGVCTAPDTCMCNGTWKGSLCNMECEQGYQKDANGTCIALCYGIISSAKEVCSGNGICANPDTCMCFANFTGPTCSKTQTTTSNMTCFGLSATDINVCSQHGTCIASDKCNCTAPWIGDLCNMECEPGYVKDSNGTCVIACFGIVATDPKACSGKGTCLGINVCNCTSEYRGSQCESLKPPPCGPGSNVTCENICFGIAESDINVCSRNGKCIAPDTCNCTTPFIGALCNSCPDGFSVFNGTCIPICYGATSVASIVCNGKGICTAPNTCVCNANYTGNQCDVSLINCTIGFGGDNCSTPICFGVLANETATVCSGKGICTAPNICNCTGNFTGSACEFVLCSTGFASINSTCVPMCNNIPATNTSIVCSGNGTCIGVDTCNCTAGFVGKNCEFNGTLCATGYVFDSNFTCVPVCFAIPANETLTVCSGHGNCSAPDTCVCSLDYIGPQCNVTICNGKFSNDSKVCSGRGNCTAKNNCTCDGGLGIDCETPICYGYPAYDNNVCSNGKGVCTDKNTCVCALGWSGTYCNETQCWDVPSTSNLTCSGHGACVAPHACVCTGNWTGKACEIPICFGVFANSTAVCSGRGNCSAPNNCTCFEPTKYTGSSCEIRILPTCSVGYGGEDCSPICYGLLSNNTLVCSGNGNCSAPDTCVCKTGWTGIQCTVPTCFGVNSTSPLVCSGKGTCGNPDNCTCSPGYNGTSCSSTICATGYALNVSSAQNVTCVPLCNNITSVSTAVCNGRGTCTGPETCKCNFGFSGKYCQNVDIICFGVVSTNTSFVCNGRGNCSATNACVCKIGYGGTQCELFTCFGKVSSDTTVCSGKGNCSGVDTCKCVTGFEGTACDTVTCPLGYNVTTNKTACEPVCNTLASSNPLVCSGNGNCTAPNTCTCNTGYSGLSCETKNPTPTVAPATSAPVPSCNVGYGGAQCNIPICYTILATNPLACSGNGTCVAPNKCNCTANYTGDQCTILVTPISQNATCFGKNDATACSGNGTCVIANSTDQSSPPIGICNCNSGYMGAECEIISCFGVMNNASNVCSGQGTCSGPNICNCKTGFKGTACAEKSLASTSRTVSGLLIGALILILMLVI